MINVPPDLDPDVVAAEGTMVAVQRKVLDLLRALPVLMPVKHIFCEDSKTLDDDLNKALTGLEPMSICIELGAWKDDSSGVPGRIDLSDLQVLITVFECTLFSRGFGGIGLTLNRVIELIATSLKCQPIGNSFLDKPRVESRSIGAKEALTKTLVFTLSVTMLQTLAESETESAPAEEPTP